jgi:monoamine oxidase
MPDVTRRGFINLVGRAGGAAALYNTLGAMGLLAAPSAHAGPPQLPARSGRGIHVAILGAGIAGMTAAYELRKAGYRCTILEARERPGGRVWTLRGGDAIEETDSSQRVTWDRHRDLYFNAGPARIPQHHQGILSYCRELGVPLEIFMSDNRDALLQDDAVLGGQPQRARRVIHDTRGAIAAMAAQAIAPRDRDLRRLVQSFGSLGADMTYTGSPRAGFADAPGAGEQAGQLDLPLSLEQIAQAAAWRLGMFFAEAWNHAATMLQPVGGMDAIPRAFARVLGPLIRYHAEVVRIRRAGDRARVIWRDRRSGRESVVDADFVICTIPLPVLRDIDAEFIEPVKRAIGTGADSYVPAVKVAFQANRRWWETDHHIYGGISWTSRDITQVWYPSHGFHGNKGVVLGAYVWTHAIGERFAAMTPAERHAAAATDGERLHPGYAGLVERGASVAWSKVPFSRGGWVEWNADARREAYPILLAGDGPFYFAGEHMSYINGWQEGAVRSAHSTVKKIAERARARGAP